MKKTSTISKSIRKSKSVSDFSTLPLISFGYREDSYSATTYYWRLVKVLGVIKGQWGNSDTIEGYEISGDKKLRKFFKSPWSMCDYLELKSFDDLTKAGSNRKLGEYKIVETPLHFFTKTGNICNLKKGDVLTRIEKNLKRTFNSNPWFFTINGEEVWCTEAEAHRVLELEILIGPNWVWDRIATYSNGGWDDGWHCTVCDTKLEGGSVLECECTKKQGIKVFHGINIFLPWLGHPFGRRYTVYRDDEQDYGKENGGQPYPSWLISNGLASGTVTGYIRNADDALMTLKRLIENEFKAEMAEEKRVSDGVKAEYAIYKEKGIDAFKV